MLDRHLARSFLAGLAAFVLLFAAFALRNLEPLTFPLIFAEDGAWYATVERDGALAASLTVRLGFPVLGVVLLQDFAIRAVGVLFSGDFAYLPAAYFLASNAFMAGFALLACVVLRRFVSAIASLCVVAAIVLMPVGLDGNEIFGRLLNLSFLVPPLTVLLLAEFGRARKPAAALIALSVALLVCMMTMPVALMVAAAWLVLMLAMFAVPQRFIDPSATSARAATPSRAYAWLLIGLVVACAAITIYLLPAELTNHRGGSEYPVARAAMVEFALARTALYPFVAAFYNRLNDAATVAFTALYAGVCLLALWQQVRAKGLSDRAFLLLLAGAGLACQIIALVGFRAGLSALFANYQSTFPDRYFYGVNVTSVLVLAIAVDCLTARSARLTAGAVTVALFLLGVAIHWNTIFELSRPAMTWRERGDIVQSTCAFARGALPRKPDPAAERVAVPIVPTTPDPGWIISVSRAHYDLFVRRHCPAR